MQEPQDPHTMGLHEGHAAFGILYEQYTEGAARTAPERELFLPAV